MKSKEFFKVFSDIIEIEDDIRKSKNKKYLFTIEEIIKDFEKEEKLCFILKRRW